MVNFNPIDEDYIVSWHSDLENTKESKLPVCDKHYRKIKDNMPVGEELENLWNYPLIWEKGKTHRKHSRFGFVDSDAVH